MATWNEFEQVSPEMAARGRALLYQHGIGLGYLATVRKDGGPRVHPFCPILVGSGLFGLIAPSPKQGDLLRDRRFAVHTFPVPDRDDEFYLSGRAIHREDRSLADQVRASFLASGGTSSADEMLFEFDIEHALLATYKKRGEPNNWPPIYTKWHARP
ncbi:MAG: hypothetical protein HYR72_17450 [Deltaproteobacteria bacterium]|nr:hypothetical protein [Deltaproteobacteria bacterium]MBI3386493.1 hypothetical protein [Deltaproteobacteria bacterium]